MHVTKRISEHHGESFPMLPLGNFERDSAKTASSAEIHGIPSMRAPASGSKRPMAFLVPPVLASTLALAREAGSALHACASRGGRVTHEGAGLYQEGRRK